MAGKKIRVAGAIRYGGKKDTARPARKDMAGKDSQNGGEKCHVDSTLISDFRLPLHPPPKRQAAPRTPYVIFVDIYHIHSR